MAANTSPQYAVPDGAIRVPVGSDIQALVNAAPAGATFWIEAGTHRMQDITPKDGQTFVGAEGAVLNGSQLITSFARENSLWVAGGQTQQGMRNAMDEGAPGAQRPGYPETFFIDDKPLKPVDAPSKVTAGTFHLDYDADKIYFADDPNGHKVEAGKADQAFSGGADGVTVRNLVVEKYNSPVQHGAISADGDNWVVEDNEARLNHGVGITSSNGAKVIGNHVHDNGQMGLGGNGDRMLVEGNEIARNGHWAGIDPYWEGGGSKWAETDGLVVRDNHSHGNNGFGLWTDINNINTLYEGNRIENNSGGGINHEISYAAVIRNNTLVGNGTSPDLDWLWGSAIQLQNSRDVEVHGNRIDMTGGGNGIGLIQQDRGAGTHGAWVTTGNHVHDNVMVGMTPDDGAFGMVADHGQDSMLAGGNVFDHNEYHVSDPADDHWAWGRFLDWNTYRQVSGQDAHSTVSTQPRPIGPAPEPTPAPDPAFTYAPGDWSDTPAPTRNVNGRNASETLNGTAADEKFNGKGGNDRMVGADGSDTYVVDSAGDRVVEHAGRGTDLVLLRTPSFTMPDNVENLKVEYRGGAAVYGNGRDNGIVGGPGNDTVVGGRGADRMTGGAGNDTFVLRKDEAAGDMVVDFRGNGAAPGDTLRLEGFGAGAELVHAGDVWTVKFTGGSETLRIIGVDALSAGDYLFS